MIFQSSYRRRSVFLSFLDLLFNPLPFRNSYIPRSSSKKNKNISRTLCRQTRDRACLYIRTDEWSVFHSYVSFLSNDATNIFDGIWKSFLRQNNNIIIHASSLHPRVQCTKYINNIARHEIQLPIQMMIYDLKKKSSFYTVAHVLYYKCIWG